MIAETTSIEVGDVYIAPPALLLTPSVRTRKLLTQKEELTRAWWCPNISRIYVVGKDFFYFQILGGFSQF